MGKEKTLQSRALFLTSELAGLTLLWDFHVWKDEGLGERSITMNFVLTVIQVFLNHSPHFWNSLGKEDFQVQSPTAPITIPQLENHSCAKQEVGFTRWSMKFHQRGIQEQKCQLTDALREDQEGSACNSKSISYFQQSESASAVQMVQCGGLQCLGTNEKGKKIFIRKAETTV